MPGAPKVCFEWLARLAGRRPQNVKCKLQPLVRQPACLDDIRVGTVLDYLVRFELPRLRSDVPRRRLIADLFSVPANAPQAARYKKRQKPLTGRDSGEIVR